MILREYQERFIQEIRAAFFAGSSSVLGVMPTGSGKTVCFSNLAMRVREKGKRIAILVHRDELLEQVSETLDAFNVEHEVMAAGKYPAFNTGALVASVFTLVRRLGRTPIPDMMIVDEAHHAIGKSTWGKVIQHWKRALLLGVTATPTRLSGEGLEQLFNTMVLGPNTAELIDNGDLASYRLFAPTTIDTTGLSKRAGDFVKKELAERSDKRFITGSSIDHYKKHADGSPAIAFCISIAHANHVAEQYRDHGYRAVAIDGKMSKNWRRNIIRDFRSNRIQVLTSCDLISEGFDCPGIVTSILLRPTQSLGLYLQQVGRGLRTAPGKAEGIILDHAGNTMMHGLPDRDHEWTLKGSALPKDTGPSVKTCPKCFYVMPVHRGRCPECQHKFAGQGKARIIDEVAGELREVSPAEILAQRRASKEKSNRAYRQFKAVTLADHIAEGRRRGYKNAVGWAKHVYDAKRKRSIA